MKQGEKLYFIALVPPEPIFSKVEEFKSELSEKYNTKASLRSPPHITLHMPFNYKEEREKDITAAMRKVKLDSPLQLELCDFGAFPRRVIYINVNKTEPLGLLHRKVSDELKTELKIVKGTYKDQGFTPHLTVAFRDLRPSKFDKAWLSVQSMRFHYQWSAKSFFLLKHNGRYWEIFEEIFLT